MKKNLLKIVFCLFFLPLFRANGYAQETLQGLRQKIDITIDDLGNANIEVFTRLNAAQWETFKRNTGTNASIIKRELEKALPTKYLTDFIYTEDQMDRSYSVKMKALGLCMLNKNGSWEAKLETKNPDITRLSDREFIMNEDMMSNGMLVQQTQKLHLPSGASGARVEKDSFGSAILTYTTGMGWGHKLVNYGGIVLIAAGAGMFIRKYKSKTA